MDSCVKCLINGGGETMSSKVEKLDVPIWQRYTMTIDEAAAYFHIGRARLRALVSDDPYVPDNPPWQEPSEPWNDRTPYDVR